VQAQTLGSKRDRATFLMLNKPGAGVFEAGDYMFLCIPDISKTQWHPFSISCGPNQSNKLTFHIKAMGPNTFTQTLAERVANGWTPTVLVDGPHGKLTVDPRKCGHVMLIAGGVGITPMMSILESLLAELESPSGGQKLQTVTLLWSAQRCDSFLTWYPALLGSPAVLRLVEAKKLNLFFFATRLDEAQINAECTEVLAKAPTKGNTHDIDGPMKQSFASTVMSSDSVDLELHQMEAQAVSAFSLPVKILPGRPPTAKIIGDLNAARWKNDCGVFACGPAPLVEEAQALAKQFNLLFHKETFLL